MRTINHTCGHSQGFNDEKYTDEQVQRVLGKSREQFVEEQIKFLSSYPCPPCYAVK